MKMSTLQATQSILLIQWVIVPALGIWIWVKSSFLSALLFVIIWLIVDKVWDWLTGLLIAGAGRIEEGKVSEREALERVTSGDVPGRMAFMMIVDLLGTFLTPWVVGGFFLGWFQ
jgi:predicted Na+-dependent transporter